ncbi:hypothetical protein HanPI659440_Chr16g0642051 [Helianthus annuus]|nr:hypothetical protein HanPI659440_Chr16g0642051 [Helianthus annuus]
MAIKAEPFTTILPSHTFKVPVLYIISPGILPSRRSSRIVAGVLQKPARHGIRSVRFVRS